MLQKINLTKKAVLKRVKNKGSSRSRYIIGLICDVLSLEKVKIVGKRINRRLNSPKSRPAYNRLMLIGVELFCREKKITNYYQIERELEDNEALKAFANFKTPKYTVISTFMKELDETWLKTIFYTHLVLVNDYDPLKFDKIFIDGTDVIANASINYTINKKQVETTRLLHHWGLLHNGNENQIEKTVVELKARSDEYENNEKIYELIQIALKRPQIYTHNTYERLERIQKALDETGSKSVSIAFPESTVMKSKRGRFDVGFNLQMLMLSNHFILAGYLTRKSNDGDVMAFILDTLKSDLEIFIDIMKKYCENNDNLEELEKLLDNVTLICDSGYFTNENIELCVVENVELVVMSKQVARQENNKKREAWNQKIRDVKNHKTDKVTKYLCIRIKNGYNCPFGRRIMLVHSYITNSKYNKDGWEDESLYEYCFVHECEDCTGCPYLEKYGKPCDCAVIHDRVTKFKYESTNEFVEGKYKETYKDRMPISERVNAFFKGLTGMYHVKGRDFKSAKNQVTLTNLLHNMIHLENIKDVYYW